MDKLTKEVYRRVYGDLVNALRFNPIDKDRQPLCSMYAGRAVVEMIAGIFESQRVGGPVSLPLTQRDNPLAKLT